MYCGRIAPTPSGWLHLGHASTFTIAWERARSAGGIVRYRSEDLDRRRCLPAYVKGAEEDLRWWGLDWDGTAVYQSDRLASYRMALARLAETGSLYASNPSRAQVRAASREV